MLVRETDNRQVEESHKIILERLVQSEWGWGRITLDVPSNKKHV